MSIEDDVRQIVRDRSPLAFLGIRPEMTLDECELDSLDVAAVEAAVEEHWGIEIEPNTWDLNTRIETIAADVTRILKNRGVL